MIGHSVEELRAMGYAPFTPPQEKDSFISEGDTPTFLNLIQNGLLAGSNGDWGGWGGMSTTTTTSQTINIGTLNVDLYDVGTKQQVWRGEASKTLGSGKDPQKVNKNLNKAVAKLFKKYPPPAK